MSVPKEKSERIDFRVRADFKALFARAAELSGTNLTAFIIEAARERASELIAQHERLVLNNAARDTLLAALARPPRPAPALVRAAKRSGSG